jgi:protein-tyrosine phosphatase
MITDGTLPFTDVHCHLLPGIDDGPKDWDETLSMARLAAADGIGTVVATPHQLGRYESNSTHRIRALTAEAQQRVAAAGIPLTILPGADVRVHEDLPGLVRQREVLTVADRRTHLLVELPHNQLLPLGEVIYALQGEEICCILSHPERNGRLVQNPAAVRPWVQQGCLVQVTAGSITGHLGRDAQRTSRWLLEEQLVHLIATDAHDSRRRPPCLSKSYDLVCRCVGPELAHKLFISNPKSVASGNAVEVPLPLSRSLIWGWWRRAKGALGNQR